MNTCLASSIISGIICLIGGMIFGISANENVFINDCTTVGFHRSGKVVFECKEKTI